MAFRLLRATRPFRAFSTEAAPTAGRAFRAQAYDDVPLLERPPPAASASASPSLLTATPIAEHSTADVHRYCEYTTAEIGRYFPEGFGAGVLREFGATNFPALMVRQSALEARKMIDELGGTDGALAQTAALCLEGPRGVGKSATLTYLVHAARASGWLVLAVPSAYSYLNAQQRFMPLSMCRIEIGIAGAADEDGAGSTSPSLEQLFDVPAATHGLLRGFLAAHEDLLNELPVKTEGTAGFARAINTRMSSLSDLVQVGASDTELATHTLVALMRELKAVADVPVMIAIDDVNAFERGVSAPLRAHGARARARAMPGRRTQHASRPDHQARAAPCAPRLDTWHPPALAASPPPFPTPIPSSTRAPTCS
jgi:hypothetical protein